MPARLPPHSHCYNCKDPITEGDKFCDEECKEEYETRNKKKQRKTFLFYIIAVIVIVGIGIATTL